MNFIKQAEKGKNSWWRWVIVLIIGILPYLSGLYNCYFAPEVFSKSMEELIHYKGDKNVLFFYAGVLNIIFFIIFLLSFKFIQKRKILTVLTSRKKFDFKRLISGLISFGAISIVLMVSTCVIYYENIYLNYKPEAFFKLIALALFIFLFSFVLEEVVFRGFVIQLLGRFTKSKILIVLGSVIFYSLVTSANIMVYTVGYEFLIANFILGFFLALIVVLDGGLELVFSITCLNKILPNVFLANDWYPLKLDTLLINKVPYDFYTGILLPTIAIFSCYIFLLSQKYKWREKLLET